MFIQKKKKRTMKVYSMCIAALFIITKNWKLDKCHYVGEWIDKM